MEMVGLVRNTGVPVRGQAAIKSEAVAEAERTIDRALAPKKLRTGNGHGEETVGSEFIAHHGTPPNRSGMLITEL